MAGSAVSVIRNAVWKVLNDDNTLTSTLGATVHQSVPDNQASPYVVLGPCTEVSNNSFNKTRRDVSLTIDCWSDSHDEIEAESIADRVDDLLDFKSDLTVSGYTVIAIHHDGHDLRREPDQTGDWNHVIARYLVRVEE